MYPSRPRPDTKSAAEVTLHLQFARQLPDDYVVFHSISWVLRDPKGGARDGETDFVIVHPERGILLVEVKGGNIRIDGQTSEWFSNAFPIKNPFDQARTNKYSLRDKLRETPFWRDRFVSVGHAVAFPDLAVKHNLGLDAPNALILDREDLATLRIWVECAYDYWKGEQRTEPIGEIAVRDLITLFSPSWDLHVPLVADFAGEHAAILRLTEEQHGLLDFLSGRRRVAIHGCAGSGKTTLAVEQARRLASQGFRVLLVCFNKNLAAYLRSDPTLSESVDIYHFHGLCTGLVKRAGLHLVPGRENDASWFEHTLPEAMLDALDILGPQYDVVIVDEGQDFRPAWWLPIQCLFSHQEDGLLYLFYDDNQNLYESTLDEIANLDQYQLTVNCRNTQHIHRAFLPFYRGENIPSARGPEGRAPNLYDYSTEQEFRKRLGAVLQKIVGQERVPTDQVVILTQHAPQQTLLWKRPMVGSWQLTEQWPPASGEVYATTIHQFKGLESPIVILAELTPSSQQDLDTLLYVGCSRARNHLILLVSADLSGDLRGRLPSGA